MNSFLDLCQTRQSCRSYMDKPVEHEKLVNCINAASLAPSACNSQPWSFIVAEELSIVERVADAVGIMGKNGFAKSAKAFFVVIEEHATLMPSIRGLLFSQYFAAGDVGASVSYLCLEAAEQGLGTCIMGLFDRVKIAEIFDIPKEKRIRLVVAAGYPSTDVIKEKTRKSMEEIAKFY